ncbi:hypothetical protein [Embleya sp. NBC_00896]|uniref:hypothetical protein n=1 Tax=Embleya sp. NBC_00896 TaxID=2975961 RepID=UPI00386C762F|nr:hypothetical protein OG928_33490 [Embleya sp. NBC_00896]
MPPRPGARPPGPRPPDARPTDAHPHRAGAPRLRDVPATEPGESAKPAAVAVTV